MNCCLHSCTLSLICIVSQKIRTVAVTLAVHPQLFLSLCLRWIKLKQAVEWLNISWHSHSAEYLTIDFIPTTNFSSFSWQLLVHSMRRSHDSMRRKVIVFMEKTSSPRYSSGLTWCKEKGDTWIRTLTQHPWLLLPLQHLLPQIWFHCELRTTF